MLYLCKTDCGLKCTTFLVFHLEVRFAKALFVYFESYHFELTRRKNRNLLSTPQCWSKKKGYRINFKTNYPDIFCFPVGVVVNVIAKITFTRRNVNIPAMRKAGSLDRNACKFPRRKFYLNRKRIVCSSTANDKLWVLESTAGIAEQIRPVCESRKSPADLIQ